MKTHNPIHGTVTNFVTAKRGRRKSKSKTLRTSKTRMAKFFADLENRGPFRPGSFFERWTKQIRKEMQESGEWIKDDEESNFLFVANYIMRLQILYFQDEERRQVTFKKIYLKVRIWGLRVKLFTIGEWESIFCSSRTIYLFPYIKNTSLYSIKPSGVTYIPPRDSE